MRIVPVVMSGGSGTRLWPLSRNALPKQFVELIGNGTMIQQTVRRAALVEGTGAPIVVANESHVDLVIEQLSEVDHRPETVIAEPVGRNTAPAVALAAHALDPDDIMVVLSADAAIGDVDSFVAAVHTAIGLAADGDLVTFGVPPTRPETGYGYIEAEYDGNGVGRVLRFVEKPDQATAEHYLASGRFSWNSGMFVFTAEAYLSELSRFEPDLARLAGEAISAGRSVDGRLIPGEAFSQCPSISIDTAVMELTDRARVVRLDAGWSDVGSWDSLWELAAPHRESNVVTGSAILAEVTGSLIRGSDRLIAVIGLDDVVIVDTPEALLVVARDHAQDIKRIVDRLPPDLQ